MTVQATREQLTSLFGDLSNDSGATLLSMQQIATETAEGSDDLYYDGDDEYEDDDWDEDDWTDLEDDDYDDGSYIYEDSDLEDDSELDED